MFACVFKGRKKPHGVSSSLSDCKGTKNLSMKKYTYLTKTQNEEMIALYKCEFLKEIEENEYFGNSESGQYTQLLLTQ